MRCSIVTGCAALAIASGTVYAQKDLPRPAGADGDAQMQYLSLSPSDPVRFGGDPGEAPAGDSAAFLLPLGGPVKADEHADAKFLPDGSGVVVANRRTKNLVIFNPDTRALIGSVQLSGRPHALAINPAGTVAVTANLNDGTASIVDLAARTEVAVIPTGVYPGSALITPDGTRALIHNNGRVVTSDPYGKFTVINLATNTVEREIGPTGFSNLSFAWNTEWHAIGMSPQFLSTSCPVLYDNSTVLFPVWTNTGDTQILKIDIGTGAITPITVASQPRLIVVSGAKAYVVHTGSAQRVTEIDVPSATVTRTIPAPVALNGAAAINGAGDKLAVSVSNNFRVLDLVTGAFTGDVGPLASVNALLTTHDGDHFIAASIQGTVASFNGTVVTNFGAPSQFILGAVSPTTDRAALFSAAFGQDMLLVNTTVGGVAQLSGGPTGPSPSAHRPRQVAVNAAGTRAVTANVLSLTASVVDLTNRTVVATLPIQRRAGGVGVTPDGSKAVIASRDGVGVDIIDLATNTATAVTIGAAPIRADGVVFSPDSHYAYVNTVTNDGVYRIDLTTNTVSPRVPTGDMGSIIANAFAFSGLAISPDGSKLVTCNSANTGTGNSLTFIDTATMTASPNVPVATQPMRAVFSADGARLYVSSTLGNAFSAVDMTTNPPTVVGSANIGNSPLEIRLNPAGTRAYVQATLGTSPFSPVIAVVDTTVSPPALVAQWTFPTNPSWSINDFELSADGSKLYVSRGITTMTAGGAGAFHTENGTFQVLDAATGEILDEVPTGRYATSLAKNAADTVFVTADIYSDAVSIIGEATPVCYANCDGSTATPVLNVNDFICFQTRYAAQDPAANCDGSTTEPVLNVNDFICFQSAYAAGCP